MGVNSDEDREELKTVMKEEKLSWRSWWDGSIDGPIHEKWQITARPSIFVLDKKSAIRFKSTSADGLDAVIEELLQQN